MPIVQGDETARRLVKHACFALLEFQTELGLPERRPQIDSTIESDADEEEKGARGNVTTRRKAVRVNPAVRPRLPRPLRPRDSSCGERVLHAPVHGKLDDSGSGLLRVSLGELEALAMQPLKQMDLDVYIEHVPSRKASGLAEPPRTLKEVFDVDSHPYASTHVAKELLQRLDADLGQYAAVYENQRTAQLLTLQPEEISECVQKALLKSYGSSIFGSRLERALKRLGENEERRVNM